MHHSAITSMFLLLSAFTAPGCGLVDFKGGDTGDDDETNGPDDTNDDQGTSCDPLGPDPVPGPDCLSGNLGCGETVTATTRGGSSAMGTDLYEAAFCFVPWDDYDASSERVYAFILPADRKATLRLDSPCADLDLILMRWEEDGYCPTENHPILECDADTDDGGGSLEVWNDQDSRYLIIVDGKNGAQDNFTLQISCGG